MDSLADFTPRLRILMLLRRQGERPEITAGQLIPAYRLYRFVGRIRCLRRHPAIILIRVVK
ncbi:hypothetical protein KCP70_18340 [Salmonella enterica subsp. enterica]|nr:hypothetical protein KCP70_18340 [Salmonella enterica subsp. enterica]